MAYGPWRRYDKGVQEGSTPMTDQQQAAYRDELEEMIAILSSLPQAKIDQMTNRELELLIDWHYNNM